VYSKTTKKRYYKVKNSRNKEK